MNPQSSQRPLPLSLPTLGGRGFRLRSLRNAGLVFIAVAAFVVLYLAARPRVAPNPIRDLHKNGVHGVYNLHAKNGELLVYNFRAIEPGKLYRASEFPRNHGGVLAGKKGLHSAAFFNREAFDFLRSKNIRLIVTVNEPKDFYALQGYLDKNGRQTGYRIRLVAMTTTPQRAYVRESRLGERIGLRTAIEFIDFMKAQAPGDGAVLLQGQAGKDVVGVVAAAYELWRNVGYEENEVIWQQVMERYLVSDVLIKRDKEARKFAGKPVKCKDGKMAYVCPEYLASLRLELERIAQMD